MLLDIGFVVIGLVGLYFGADWLVEGASRLAGSFGVEPLIIGLTVVALGTSMPELLVSMTAALNGKTDMAMGNVVGSNIANVGLILGASGVIAPLAINTQLVRREIPAMIGVSVTAYFLALDGEIGFWDGVFLLIALVIFTVLIYMASARESRMHPPDESPKDEINRGREAVRLVVGIIVLLIGAQVLVQGAVGIAEAFNVSDAVIGFTLLALGTSLPELATSIVASMNGQTDIAVGNVVGSNLSNLMLILGSVSVVNPIDVGSAVTSYQMPVMLAFSIILLPFALDFTLQRREAFLFLTAYLAFSITLFVA